MRSESPSVRCTLPSHQAHRRGCTGRAALATKQPNRQIKTKQHDGPHRAIHSPQCSTVPAHHRAPQSILMTSSKYRHACHAYGSQNGQSEKKKANKKRKVATEAEHFCTLQFMKTKQPPLGVCHACVHVCVHPPLGVCHACVHVCVHHEGNEKGKSYQATHMQRDTSEREAAAVFFSKKGGGTQDKRTARMLLV